MFNQRLWLGSVWNVSSLGLFLCPVSLGDVMKCTYYVSIKDGGQRGDWFSLHQRPRAKDEIKGLEGREGVVYEASAHASSLKLCHAPVPISSFLVYQCFINTFCPLLFIFFPTLQPFPYLSSLCFPSVRLLPRSPLIFFWQEQWFDYPTSPLPGWVRYCGGVVFTWQLTQREKRGERCMAGRRVFPVHAVGERVQRVSESLCFCNVFACACKWEMVFAWSLLQPHLVNGLWASLVGTAQQIWHADARMWGQVSAATSKEPQSNLTAQWVTRPHWGRKTRTSNHFICLTPPPFGTYYNNLTWEGK